MRTHSHRRNRMPHLTLEHSQHFTSNTIQSTLLALNGILAQSGHFDEIDIKSRSLCVDNCTIGIHPNQRAFMHIKLAILSGRSQDIKQMLSQELLHTLEKMTFPDDLHIQLCVEIQDIDKATYSKTAISPQS